MLSPKEITDRLTSLSMEIMGVAKKTRSPTQTAKLVQLDNKVIQLIRDISSEPERSPVPDPLPSAEENPKGFHRRYLMTRADGSPLDPDSVYLNLRLDSGGKDPNHIRAGRVAARVYANEIRPFLPELADDLRRRLDAYEREDIARAAGETS